jgi:hypothetical protein
MFSLLTPLAMSVSIVPLTSGVITASFHLWPAPGSACVGVRWGEGWDLPSVDDEDAEVGSIEEFGGRSESLDCSIWCG